MTKIKETPKDARVRSKVLSGKITKAKDLKVVPESPHSKQIEVKLRKMPLDLLSTPFPKDRLTCTSTPMSVNNSSQPRREKYQTISTLSPVLCEIGNLTTRSRTIARAGDVAEKDNKSRFCSDHLISTPGETVKRKRAERRNGLAINTIQKPGKVSDEDASITSETQSCQSVRKSARLGSRSVAASGQHKSGNLRVRVARCSLDSVSNLTVDGSGNTRTRRTQAKEFAHKLQADNTLVNKIRSDWSNTTYEETPNKTQPANGKTIYKTPLGLSKRRLTTLIETTFNESIAAVSPVKRHRGLENNEDAYSSSAEFESDDEKENAHSKRAPTWKDLSHKTKQSINLCMSSVSPKVRVRRSRRVSEISSLCSEGAKRRILRRKSTENLSPKSKESTEDSSNENEGIQLSVNRASEQRSTQQEMQSEEANEKGDSPTNLVNVITEINKPSSPSSSPQNLFSKSDLIEQLLSSADDVGEENAPTTTNDITNRITSLNNTNTAKKFFHSRVDSTLPVSNSVKTSSKRRSMRGKKKKMDSVYEFLSQSSSDNNDPLSDVIQKMINSGKVTVAKHRKGTGMNFIAKVRRKAPVKKQNKTESDGLVKPKPVPQSNSLKKNLERDIDDDETPFDDGGGDLFEEDPKRDQRGFSDLARSAMIKHAGKNKDTPQRTMITDRKKLLEIAQRVVGQSTPLGKSQVPVNTTVQHSPIPGNSSPWRVDDDKLPTMFNFGRNSDNLPSFSSNYITTPIKSKSNSKSTSSFSSNDSNMENIEPPSVPMTSSNANNIRIYSNTRRALSYRSPLKAINIIDVVHLPRLSLKKPEKEADKEMTTKEKSTEPLNQSSNVSENNMFGFEEMINDDDAPTGVVVDKSVIPTIPNWKEQLLTLKRLRPEKPMITTSQNNRIRPVFDERPKQRTLQQMFCSTMIDHERPSVTSNELSNLFEDPEPETSFDSSNPRRTYSRPFVRKRKLRHNFVMFMDSDASDEEDDIKSDKNYGNKQKKRNNKEQKDNIELNKFVGEFNEMCKEVSEYNLIIE